MAEITVIKGDSSNVKEFTIEGYDTLDANWTGLKAVRSTLDDTPLLEAAMAKDSGNTMFLGYLTPAETDALDIGTYIVIYEITNLSIVPLFRREKQYTLEIKQHGINT